MSDALRAALTANAVALSQGVLEILYENPFWMERYGERGRRFADEDSLHHVRYLDQALASNDAAVFEKYALWLRSVLVSRGMCSEHLGENFRLLAAAIVRAGLPDAATGVRVLELGDAALRYSAGPAARLEAARAELVATVAHAAEGARTAMREDDTRYLVSYYLDALDAGRSDGFTAFAARCPPAAVAALETTATARGAALPG